MGVRLRLEVGSQGVDRDRRRFWFLSTSLSVGGGNTLAALGDSLEQILRVPLFSISESSRVYRAERLSTWTSLPLVCCPELGGTWTLTQAELIKGSREGECRENMSWRRRTQRKVTPS